MTFAGISYWAVIAAAVAGWLASAVWYMSLAHVAEKWAPVFRTGHAPTQELRAHPDSTETGCALGKIWMVALGKTHEQMRENRKSAFLPFIYAFVANLVIAWMLAGVLGHLGAGQATLPNGVISAAFLWFGFVLTTMTVNYTFAGRGVRLLLIDAGNWLVVLLVMGAIIGAIGV